MSDAREQSKGDVEAAYEGAGAADVVDEVDAAEEDHVDEDVNAHMDGVPDTIWVWMLLCAASLIEFGAAGDLKSEDSDCFSSSSKCGWAIAVGVISFVFGLVGLAVAACLPANAMRATVELGLGVFLVLLWSAGVGANTSINGVAPVPGNIYYASWLAFFTSLYLMYVGFVRWTRQQAADKEAAGAGADEEPPPAEAAAQVAKAESGQPAQAAEQVQI